MRKLLAVLACVALVSQACASNDDESSDDEVTQAIESLPETCEAFGVPALGGEITFVSGGKLFVASSDGSDVRCIADKVDASFATWGAEGDRVLVRGGRTISIIDGRRHKLASAPTAAGWSRPTGTSVVYIEDGRLMKIPANGGPAEDISFLARHDDVTYHPAGTHIAVSGEAADGTYGLYIATNLGKDASLVAAGEDAQRIYSLTFSHSGKRLYFAAEHTDHYDVHVLQLASGEESADTTRALNELGIKDLYSGPDPVGRIVVSEFTDKLVAYQKGSCDESVETTIWSPDETDTVGSDIGRVTEPVGWFPDGSLALVVRADGCDGAGDLYVREGTTPLLLARNVEGPAVRANLPPPPDPPIPAAEVLA